MFQTKSQPAKHSLIISPPGLSFSITDLIWNSRKAQWNHGMNPGHIGFRGEYELFTLYPSSKQKQASIRSGALMLTRSWCSKLRLRLHCWKHQYVVRQRYHNSEGIMQEKSLFVWNWITYFNPKKQHWDLWYSPSGIALLWGWKSNWSRNYR